MKRTGRNFFSNTGYVFVSRSVFGLAGRRRRPNYQPNQDELVHADNHDPRVVDAPDEQVEQWLGKAQTGDVESLERLRCWAYFSANRYYESKVHVEKALSAVDVADLTSTFYVDFEKIWPKARSITRYGRMLMKSTLGRFIGARRRRREIPFGMPGLDDLTGSEAGVDEEPRGFQSWGDTEWDQYEAILIAFADADEVTRKVVAARLSTPPVPYADLAVRMITTEAALRMRMSRFYGLARLRFEETEFRRRRSRVIRPFGSNETIRRPWLE